MYVKAIRGIGHNPMNYLFYDYETSGRNHKYDQILQFAAIKTDSYFDQIGEPIEYFCKLRRDILPSPEAIAINQIDIYELNSIGLNEFDFAKRVAETLVGDGNQCVVGYNSKAFDDKFTRFLLYRNFQKPYAWYSKYGNSCFDIFDVMSLGFSFDRLKEIKIEDGGETSLRLENLSRWNHLDHDDAHNAVSDVRATIQLAKLVREKSPKLYDYAFDLRNYGTANQIINSCEMFFHSSSLNGYPNRFLSLHTPICRHPVVYKSTIGWDLKYDPTELLNLSAEEIRLQLYSKKEKRKLDVGFDEFKLNHCPMIVKFNQAEKKNLIDADRCDTNFRLLRANLDTVKKLALEVFNTTIPEEDPDVDLYVSDFFPQADLHSSVFNQVLSNPLAIDESQFKHVTFRRLFRRMKARNFHSELNEVERSRFAAYCTDKFGRTDEDRWITKSTFDQEMGNALATATERQNRCLKVLQEYADTL